MRTTTPTTPRQASSTRRLRLAAGLMALGATTVFSAGCSGSASEPAAPTTRPPAVTAAPSPSESEAGTDTPATPAAVEAPSSANLVVRPTSAIEVHEQPNDSSPGRTVAATTSFGSATALLVTDQAPGWVQVLVPGRPTGTLAWASAEDAGTLQSVSMEINVDLAAHTLVLTDDGAEVLRTSVAVGAPDTPTPTGRFSVTDKLDTQKPGGAYGRYAVGLSARSEVISEFAGGDGQIGIHGTNEPASIGNAVSHGCIRVPGDVMEQLNGILSLGTPVVVS